jgi:hypothetical protein
MNHFEKLLEETSPNHAYPIKHKLRDCGMIKNFMASVSLAQGMEVDKVLDEGDTMPFPGEDAVSMIYDGHPSPGMLCMSNPMSYPGSRKHKTEASIRVPRKFNHTHGNNMINR